MAKKIKLTLKAKRRLNEMLISIENGIANISELRNQDLKEHSLDRGSFELIYVDKVFAPTIQAISEDIRILMEMLACQKEEQLKQIAKEEKKENENI